MAKVFTYSDLQEFFKEKAYKVVVAGDSETVMHVEEKGKIVPHVRPGGVSVALEPIVRASQGTFIARGRTEADKNILVNGKVKIESENGSYYLKRFFISEEEADLYYDGFSNQSFWPLCHVAFQEPGFHRDWFEGFSKVNKKIAQTIKEELKGKTFLWINDYQMSLVPRYLEKPKDTMVGMFWHIPWPTWEVFRILPQKKEVLESLLMCDFIGFHRGYHVQNFFRSVQRELEARIDYETNQVHYNKHITTVRNLPMGVDTDVIRNMYEPGKKESLMRTLLRHILGSKLAQEGLEKYFQQYKVVLGIDRLDYTKGIPAKLKAVDKFFTQYPQYIGKLIYLGMLATNREQIPTYQSLKKEVIKLAEEINHKYAKNAWKPIQLIFSNFSRKEVINFYSKADLCLITPLDDGMNLVSKEFVIASSLSEDPGMLVLSQFTGSAIDLTSALIVNPYDTYDVANAIKQGLEMSKKEKQKRLQAMVDILEERNIYEWGKDFAKATELAARDNQHT